MKNQRMVKKLGSLLLMLAMVITMSVKALPVYAAGGTINITYNPAIDGLEPMAFKLYKVAHFDSSSGEAQIAYDTAFEGCEGKVPIASLNSIKQPASDADRQEGSTWHQSWLQAAKDIDDWVNGKSITPTTNVTLAKSSTPQAINVTENGIYLLTASGNEQRVGDQYWAPLPVLIMVLDGDTDFTYTNVDLKMTTRAVVHKHSVTKVWQDAGYESGRPKSVNIGIIYGGNQIDTVELNDDNDWTYTWYSQEAEYKTLERTYSSKDPDTGVGVTTEKLNAGNDYTIPLEGTGVWSVTELDNANIDLSTENVYIWSLSGPEQTGDDEKFKLTNKVVTPAIHNPPVYKVVKGKGAKSNDKFTFRLEAISTTAGIDMPMPPGSDGNTKTVEIKAGVLYEFGEIEFKKTGEYYYKIYEVNTGKKGYKYDSTEYYLHYTVTQEGDKFVAAREVTKNGELVPDGVSRYEFVNVYEGNPPTGDYTNIILPAAVFAGAMILLAVMLVKRRQKKDSK